MRYHAAVSVAFVDLVFTIYNLPLSCCFLYPACVRRASPGRTSRTCPEARRPCPRWLWCSPCTTIRSVDVCCLLSLEVRNTATLLYSGHSMCCLVHRLYCEVVGSCCMRCMLWVRSIGRDCAYPCCFQCGATAHPAVRFGRDGRGAGLQKRIHCGQLHQGPHQERAVRHHLSQVRVRGVICVCWCVLCSSHDGYIEGVDALLSDVGSLLISKLSLMK
jgi:hypothetical protein